MSRKRINYCENMYESTSLSGVSVWWLKIGFWLWQIESVSAYHDSPEKCYEELVVFYSQA